MKRICQGCNVAAQNRGMFECPFCRKRYPDNDAELLAMIQAARVEKKDPAAINFLGERYCHGRLGLQRDMQKAVELWTEAAELGSIGSLYNLGNAYRRGRGVQKDMAKAVEFYEKATIQGHVESRYSLGCYEGEKGNYDRAVRHWLISAKMGTRIQLKLSRRCLCKGTQRKSSTQRH